MPRKSHVERLLELVEREPGITITEAANKLGLAKSTVSELSRILEEEKSIERRRRGPLVELYPLPRVREEERGRSVRIGIIRAAEYIYVPVVVKKLSQHGYRVEVLVYDNGLQATRDLVVGKLDLVFTPLITQLFYYALTESIEIVPLGAIGGAKVLENPRGEEGVATTKVSTMELCLNLVEIPEKEKVEYMGSGQQILEKLVRGETKYAVVWEPYASRAEKRGARVVASCRELGLQHCCTPALARGVVEEKREVVRVVEEAVREVARGKRVGLEWYSQITEIPLEQLKKTIKNYTYTDYLETTSVEKTLKKAGLRIPVPAIYRQALVEDYK